VYILGNPHKEGAREVFDQVCGIADRYTEVVGASLSTEGRLAVESEAERVIVLGGDGTLIGVCRSMGQHQRPLIGTNIGKLGYLTEFTVEQLIRQFDQAVAPDARIDQRMILDGCVENQSSTPRSSLAVNDFVIVAGAPYRVVRLSISIDGDHLSDIEGDGLVICSPNGSTGHNMSAGGPIAQADVDAFVLTALAPHSLSQRPVIVRADSTIEVVAERVNPGSAVLVDGQESWQLKQGDRLVIRQSEARFQVVRNPNQPRWHPLINKLGWGLRTNNDS
jgi:NAD+ kinase